MTHPAAQAAVKTAITAYATSAGITPAEAVTRFRENESTRQCVGLLVLAQADPVKLAQLAARAKLEAHRYDLASLTPAERAALSMNIITPQIAKSAKAMIDTFTGYVSFNHDGLRFSIATRKGIRAAREKLIAQPDKILFYQP